MKSSNTSLTATKSDRTVFGAAIVCAVAGVALLFCMLASAQLGPASEFAAALFWGEIIAWVMMVMSVGRGASLALIEMRGRQQSTAAAQRARRQVETLFQMTDMLQSALVYADANAVLRSTVGKLLNGFGGALYVFNNSGDRLDLSTAWGWPDGCVPPDSIIPTHCWALKRGKTHFNERGEHALLCEHHVAGVVSLEIPMMARGEVFGLLKVLCEGDDAEQELRHVQALASAVADAMSLALSNIALRERLRTQALRDPLTGLYNRRYMEDILDRYSNIAERNGSSLSAIMIDLDHFKRLNDEHGHALGDAVLGEVAAAIVGGIRPCDVACRYGGEELIVLLPDCTLEDALYKAETLRSRIERLSENRGIPISASFGVASIPETAARPGELLSSADGALYQAKQQGRNRVTAATHRQATSVPAELAVAAE